MKIEPQKPKIAFNPLVLTLETPEEVAALFTLVNHPTLTDAVDISSSWASRIISCNRIAGNPDIDADALYNALCRTLNP